jgi:hypothetical protein
VAGVHPLVGSSQPVQAGPPISYRRRAFALPIAPVLLAYPLLTGAQRALFASAEYDGYDT